MKPNCLKLYTWERGLFSCCASSWVHLFLQISSRLHSLLNTLLSGACSVVMETARLSLCDLSKKLQSCDNRWQHQTKTSHSLQWKRSKVIEVIHTWHQSDATTCPHTWPQPPHSGHVITAKSHMMQLKALKKAGKWTWIRLGLFYEPAVLEAKADLWPADCTGLNCDEVQTKGNMETQSFVPEYSSPSPEQPDMSSSAQRLKHRSTASLLITSPHITPVPDPKLWLLLIQLVQAEPKSSNWNNVDPVDPDEALIRLVFMDILNILTGWGNTCGKMERQLQTTDTTTALFPPCLSLLLCCRALLPPAGRQGTPQHTDVLLLFLGCATFHQQVEIASYTFLCWKIKCSCCYDSPNSQLCADDVTAGCSVWSFAHVGAISVCRHLCMKYSYIVTGRVLVTVLTSCVLLCCYWDRQDQPHSV